VKKLDRVAFALLQHVPDRIGTISAEDSQLLSKFHSWADNAIKATRREDAWMSDELERALMSDWNEVQNVIAKSYHPLSGDGFA
jgi:hypothetical protein